MRFVDLFAGIGGFHYALKNVLKENNKIAKLVFASEIDKYAKIAYSKNHNVDINSILNIRDYTSGTSSANKKMKEMGKIDLLMGGFPCQAFSNAGNKKGFLDQSRGTLFREIEKILEYKKPKYILLENVKHLTRHDSEKTWELMKTSLKNIGYSIPDKPILLSPHQFGISQIRWRVFIPGIFRPKKSEKIEFNFEKNYVKKIKNIQFDLPVLKSSFLKDKRVLDSFKAWGKFIKKVKRPPDRTLPVIWLDYMDSKSVNFNGMQVWKIKYINDMKEVYKKNKNFIDEWMKKNSVHKWNKRERKLEWQAGKENFDYKNAYVQLRQSGIRFKKMGVFPTLVAIVQTSIIFDKNLNKWRYLSVNEVKQLQSFPKEFNTSFVPEYQTMKQFGNSINVKIVEIILKKLLGYN